MPCRVYSGGLGTRLGGLASNSVIQKLNEVGRLLESKDLYHRLTLDKVGRVSITKAEAWSQVEGSSVKLEGFLSEYGERATRAWLSKAKKSRASSSQAEVGLESLFERYLAVEIMFTPAYTQTFHDASGKELARIEAKGDPATDPPFVWRLETQTATYPASFSPEIKPNEMMKLDWTITELESDWAERLGISPSPISFEIDLADDKTKK